MRREAVQRSRVPNEPVSKRLNTSTRSQQKQLQSNGFKWGSPPSSNNSNYDPNTSTNSATQSPTTASIEQKLKNLQAIIDKSRVSKILLMKDCCFQKTIIIDPSALPATYPILTKMMMGYDELQR
jgi:hypothetical protein